MSNNSLEIVHEGWLTKSPPTKPIWRARWRRRWFVLRHSGELPGQYFLEYYTDRNYRKLKGKIDLDQCEQVDAGLRFENRKQKYQHMFDVKTPKRIYYLAAESEQEMNKWVEYVCHVCGLKAYKDDEDEYGYGTPAEDDETAVALEIPAIAAEELEPLENTESPPVSPTSTISGPYIPISECISGKPLSSPNGLEDFNNIIRLGGGYGIIASAQYGLSSGGIQSWRMNTKNNNTTTHQEPEAHRVVLSRVGGAAETTALIPQRTPVPVNKRPSRPYETVPSREAQGSDFYDSPRKLHPPNLELRQVGNGVTPPLQSPTTDVESVFTDDEWTVPVYPPPSVNWETFPNADGDSVKQGRPSDSSAEVEFSGDIGSWSVVQRFGKYTVVDSVPASRTCRQPGVSGTLQQPVAPPRPPKPSHLLEAPNHNYLNLENVSPRPVQLSHTSKSSTASTQSETSKRTENAPVSPNECVSASECSEEPPSPVSPLVEPVETGVSDEMYDFPRSHQYANTLSSTVSETDSSGTKLVSLSRHCYSNAAPGQVNGEVFRYDFHDAQLPTSHEALPGDEPTSPRSEGSSSLASSTNAAIYSNLPSPLLTQSSAEGGPGGIPTPPAVNRGLKPGRKLSDSASIVSNEPSPGGSLTQTSPVPYPPSVDRKLKPLRKYLDPPQPEQGPIQLASPPACRVGADGTRSLRKTRAAPSPTPPSSTPTSLRNGQRRRSEHYSSSDEDHLNSPDDEQIYYYQQENRFVPAVHGKRLQEIQYLDLDLESETAGAVAVSQTPKSPERATPSGTVYKTVDFLKTEAFNRTRQKVEEERKQCSAEL